MRRAPGRPKKKKGTNHDEPNGRNKVKRTKKAKTIRDEEDEAEPQTILTRDSQAPQIQ